MLKLEKFKNLGLNETTLKALKKKGFEEPTPIQEKTIPLLLENEFDIIGQAQTGTGKTAAFALPVIEQINAKSRKIQAIVVAPTRELSIQVAEEINSLKGDKHLTVVPIYGGASFSNQLSQLKRGAQIVAGTPGRLLDHINRGTLDLSNIEFVIIDEADEMLNMGFIEDIEDILAETPKEKRVLLFSATMPSRIQKLAENFMGEYKKVVIEKKQLTTNLTDQIYFEVDERDKFETLCRIIDVQNDFYGLVFCRTKLDVDRVANKLMDRGYSAEGLHGDISQNIRERILRKFKAKKTTILVATDVAARGLDINDLTHVINFALPQDPESYVHRVGRTGRAGKEGTAITFITPSEYRKLAFIKKIARTDIRKEKIPAVSEIIDIKRNRIMAEIKEIIENGVSEETFAMARDLFEEFGPVDALAAVIKIAFKDELDEKNYKQIREITISPDKGGKTRLFVALGRDDGFSPKKLVEYMMDKTETESFKIKDVRVFDKFSFLTVPFMDAELILEYFKRQSSGRRPLVTKAKEKPNNGGNDNKKERFDRSEKNSRTRNRKSRR